MFAASVNDQDTISIDPASSSNSFEQIAYSPSDQSLGLYAEARGITERKSINCPHQLEQGACRRSSALPSSLLPKRKYPLGMPPRCLSSFVLSLVVFSLAFDLSFMCKSANPNDDEDRSSVLPRSSTTSPVCTPPCALSDPTTFWFSHSFSPASYLPLAGTRRDAR